MSYIFHNPFMDKDYENQIHLKNTLQKPLFMYKINLDGEVNMIKKLCENDSLQII